MNINTLIQNAASEISVSIENNLLQIHNIDYVTLNNLNSLLSNPQLNTQFSNHLQSLIQETLFE